MQPPFAMKYSEVSLIVYIKCLGLKKYIKNNGTVPKTKVYFPFKSLKYYNLASCTEYEHTAHLECSAKIKCLQYMWMFKLELRKRARRQCLVHYCTFIKSRAANICIVQSGRLFKQ